MVFINKNREGINTFVCAVSLYVAETPKASIKDREPLLPIMPSSLLAVGYLVLPSLNKGFTYFLLFMPFGIVAYGFVGQPFSK